MIPLLDDPATDVVPYASRAGPVTDHRARVLHSRDAFGSIKPCIAGLEPTADLVPGEINGRGGVLIALAHPGARLVDAATDEVLEGAKLAARVEAAAAEFDRHPRGAVLSLLPIEVDAVVNYLGALLVGSPVILLDPNQIKSTIHEFLNRYQPVLVTGISAGKHLDAPAPGYEQKTAGPLGLVWRRRAAPTVAAHPTLALLLTTSGTTGSQKLVRLSSSAVVTNAEAIAQVLSIDGCDVAATSLPLFYSYGLSVLNSHLRRGATVVLERSGLPTRDFWTAVSRYGVTSLAAVPYQYEILRRLRLDPRRYPTMRTLTQAGGRLSPDVLLDFHARMAAVGGRMFVMYGQTEAAPRITTLPWNRLPEKAGSVGPPIPGGRLAVRTDPDLETVRPGVTGEIIYRGPNVMMGYAESATDLARGDDLRGVLATGDLGHLDGDGFLTVTGRARRTTKVLGVRVNLDDVERLLHRHGPIAAVSGDDKIHIFVAATTDEVRREIRSELAGRFRTHPSVIDIHHIDSLPTLSSGKIDYRALEALV